MQVTTCCGGIDRPLRFPDLLLAMLEEALRCHCGRFIIFSDQADPSGDTYAQATRDDDGKFQVEHQQGTIRKHYATVTPTAAEAARLMAGWAQRTPGWDARSSWPYWLVKLSGRGSERWVAIRRGRTPRPGAPAVPS